MGSVVQPVRRSRQNPAAANTAVSISLDAESGRRGARFLLSSDLGCRLLAPDFSSFTALSKFCDHLALDDRRAQRVSYSGSQCSSVYDGKWLFIIIHFREVDRVSEIESPF